MIKPGYKTSEFWFTLVSFIFSGFYLLGLISDNGQKEDLIRDVSHGVESIILIGGQLAILFKYLNSRKEIKKTFYSSQPTPETEETIEDVTITTPVPSRKSKSRSRKSSSRKPKNTRRS
jgi:hypothetical protein